MELLIEHKNKTQDYAWIESVISAIKTEYAKKIEYTVTDVQTVVCTILYNVEDWNENDVFSCVLHKREQKSTTTDVKWSTFMAMVDCIVTQYRVELKKYRVVINIAGDPPMQKNTQQQVPQDDSEIRLNVEPVIPRYSLSQLILPEKINAELRDVITLIKKRELIYNDWGFSEVDPVARSVINFYGPPGTGKTMAAHAIVKELNLPFLPLNYSDIESKYVGDAPKNLVAAFKKAKETGAVLFFDEADSFLGKRITSVSSSSDQAINSLRSQLLILLETYDVITIFATNLKENYDSAFDSRILKHIRFELPNKDLRIQIIQKHIPSKAPFSREEADELFWNTLGDLSEGLAPRELKNLVLGTLIKAAAADAAIITQEMFTAAFTEHKQKRAESEHKQEERKQKLGAAIQHNLKTGNYTAVHGVPVKKTKRGKGKKQRR